MHSVLLVSIAERQSLSIIFPETLKERTEKLLEVKYDGFLKHILRSKACLHFGQSHLLKVSLCCFSLTSHFECLHLALHVGAEYGSSLQCVHQLFSSGNKKLRLGWNFWGMGKNYVKTWLLNRKFWYKLVLFNLKAPYFLFFFQLWENVGR